MQPKELTPRYAALAATIEAKVAGRVERLPTTTGELGYRVGPEDLLAVARRIVPPDVATVTQAGLDYLEICPAGVDKGTGLAVVAEAVGVDPADVLVFGDMPNDLPMFGWAGWGRVAVANAHPELLSIADAVTLSNDEDGVAVFLDRLLSR